MKKMFSLYRKVFTMNRMGSSLRQAYGSYPIPPVIHRLLELSQEYTAKGFDMSWIGFRMTGSYAPYSITPPDLIPFAETGGGGIHFGFLTDFGKVKNLESAAIVCVTPTNDPPIRLIARNMAEFLDLVVSVPHAEHLESWWACTDEEMKRQEEAQFEAESPVPITQTRKEIFERLRSEFGAKPRAVLPYLREVLRERESSCSLLTLDGLGVMGEDAPSERFDFDASRAETKRELSRMRTYLSNASSTAAKLAFIRDANYWYVLDRDQPSPVSKLLRETMLSLDLQDEAARLFDIDL
ncbi:hypothetical protein P4H46_07355 [Paenibacillus glucanolyticus]|uniref:hypothetical protein n=1 Tax=Paenibacillus glucanolyticus TaxID=59843 RepID=UPI0030C90209